jgi:hypothetical protein
MLWDSDHTVYPSLIPWGYYLPLIPLIPLTPTLQIPLPFSRGNVADDSSLRQAINVETKRNAGSSRSSTKPDAETSHAPTTQTIVERFYSRYTFVQGKKRVVTLGSCG